MGATYQTLIEIKTVTDHDCGNYHIGKIDYGIRGTLREHIKNNRSKNEILLVLSRLIHEVHLIADEIGQTEFPSETFGCQSGQLGCSGE